MGTFREGLPQGCPPMQAVEPSELIVFRTVLALPPVPADFASHRARFPEKRFHVGECQARSVSVFTSVEECHKLLKLPKFRGQSIVKLCLGKGSGRVLQTTENVRHISWWLYSDYDPVSSCEAA